jgi:hypothetical protein
MMHLAERTQPRHDAPDFPHVEEISATVDYPESEESVLQRLSAPFSYLPDHERQVLKRAARTATRRMRAWIFDEPEVENAKKRLGVYRGKKGTTCPCSRTVRLAEFRGEYTTLLAESCVLQHRIAQTLAAQNPLTGQTSYVRSVRDAMQRHDRDTLLRRALELFEETSAHEQRRFALGSSLKDLVQRELSHYPVESHQLLLTSSRGDFWSRYERDLLAYVEHPTPAGEARLTALYFDGDDAQLAREVQRVQSLTPDAARNRRQAHNEQQERLARARIHKGYARLGDLRLLRQGSSADAKANIAHIDQLLWVDNVLEKFIDHKHLLHHDLFLRLHLVRLAVAVVLRARGILPHEVTDRAIRDVASDLLGDATAEFVDPAKLQAQEADLTQLTAWFGEAARAFTQPDTKLFRRLNAVLWEQSGSRRRSSRPAPRMDEAVWVAA